MRAFHNPYNFVPWPARDVADRDLGDHAPAGHDRLVGDLFTGSVDVRVTAATPLILPAHGADDRHDGPRQMRTRTHPAASEDAPAVLPVSSLRGALRTAYEAVTSSRLGVLDGADRLGHRLPARGTTLVPARVEDDGTTLTVTLLRGTSRIGANGAPQPDPDGPAGSRAAMYAAWIPAYRRQDGVSEPYASTGPRAVLPGPGDRLRGRAATASLRLVARHKPPRNGRPPVVIVHWLVTALTVDGEAVPLGYHPAILDAEQTREKLQQQRGTLIEGITAGGRPITLTGVAGWIHVTHRNTPNKHDERFLFTLGPPPAPITFTGQEAAALREQYRQLVADYRAQHTPEDLTKHREKSQGPQTYVGGKPGEPAWSPHLVAPQAEATGLAPETLAYARVGGRPEHPDVLALSPVPLPRELFPDAPLDLARADRVDPAATLDDLSPADRVFGWVRPGGEADARAAVRGSLRISPPTTQATPAGGQTVRLPELSSPKPSQTRFYLRNDKEAATFKADGTNHLAGRKFYVPNKSTRTWDPAKQGSTWPFDQRAEVANKRAADLLDWVPTGTEFTTTVSFQNLSEVELGALLYLLTRPDDHTVAIGGGRPLGFGRVHLDRVAGSLRAETGLEQGKRLRALELTEPAPMDGDAEDRRVQRFVQCFVEAASRFAPNRGEPAPSCCGSTSAVLAQVCRAMSGWQDDVPVTYPPSTSADPTEGFTWWRDSRVVLPDLTSSGVLTAADPPQAGRQGGNRPAGRNNQHGRGRGRPGQRPR